MSLPKAVQAPGNGPDPTPSSSRPPLSRSRVAASSATFRGSSSGSTSTPDASSKDHFVLVDCVGVCEQTFTDAPSLERTPTVSFDKLLDYVRKTGEDLKRTGEEFLDQAQRTFDDLRDPAQQERLKARVAELRTWAKGKFEEARTRAEDALGIQRPKAAPTRSAKTRRPAARKAKGASRTTRKPAGRAKGTKRRGR